MTIQEARADALALGFAGRRKRRRWRPEPAPTKRGAMLATLALVVADRIASDLPESPEEHKAADAIRRHGYSAKAAEMLIRRLVPPAIDVEIRRDPHAPSCLVRLHRNGWAVSYGVNWHMLGLREAALLTRRAVRSLEEAK